MCKIELTESKAIKIEFDKKTLPKDGQRVRYRNLDTMEWFEGEYVAIEEAFFTDGTQWEHVGMVDLWEPL